MKKLLSLALALMFVLAAPLGVLAEGGDLPPSDVQVLTEPESTPTPTQAPTEAPAPEPTQAPTQEPAQDATQEPMEAPSQEPDQEPAPDPTEGVEPAPEPEALSAPSNLRWDDDGNIFFDTVVPATDRYLVTVYCDGQEVKRIFANDVPGNAPSLMILSTEALSEPGEYTFTVVALGFDGYLDSAVAESTAFQYEPGPVEDPYAELDAISALVAMVEAGELTIQEAREAMLAMFTGDIEELVLNSARAAADALSTLEALYMQAAGIVLGIDVADPIRGAQLIGTGINAWESPQELRMYATVKPNDEYDGSLRVFFALEAIQPDPNPPVAHSGALRSPVYVTIPLPEGFSANEASLTNDRGETVLFDIKNNKIGFVITSLGEYRLLNWGEWVDRETIPVLTVPIGEFLIMPEEIEVLDAAGDIPAEQEGTPPETEHLLRLLAEPPSTDEKWVSEDSYVAVIDENGILSATSVGETLITQTNAAGEESQVLVRVTPLEPIEIDRPYDRVLPSGVLESAVPLDILPAYGLNKYNSFRTSDLSTKNKVVIDLNGMVVNLTHTVGTLSGAVKAIIYIYNASDAVVKSDNPNSANSTYSSKFVLPALSNGRYSIVLFVAPSSSSSYPFYGEIYFYVENGQAYFAHEYADSCNIGAMAMLRSGIFPNDTNSMISRYGNNTSVLTSIRNQATALTASKSTQYAKALAIYDWITDNFAYDYDSLYAGTYHNDPYRTFNQRRGVCGGFANVATLMLNHVGIRSVSIIGYGGSISTVATGLANHQWNALQLDGSWYIFDTTWDMPGKYQNGVTTKSGANRYRYYLVTPQQFSFDHRATGLGLGRTSINNKAPNLEPIEAFVKRLYVNVLGRQPDTEGLITWRDGLVNGVITGAQACAGFYTSAELAAKKLTDRQFIDNLYRTCLNRAPDTKGMNDWLKALSAGATRISVMNGFVVSPEFNKICQSYGIVRGTYDPPNYRDKNMNVTMFVVRLYRNFLGREPDTKGLEGWCRGLIADGNSGSQVAYGFYSSPEFQSKKLTDDQYITILYQTLLNRLPDASGLSSWKRSIALYGRRSVYDGFIVSPEWKDLMQSYGIR